MQLGASTELKALRTAATVAAATALGGRSIVTTTASVGAAAVSIAGTVVTTTASVATTVVSGAVSATGSAIGAVAGAATDSGAKPAESAPAQTQETTRASCTGAEPGASPDRSC